MPGAVFTKGQTMVRPGIYIRTNHVNEEAEKTTRGTVAAIFKSSWGPLGLGKALESVDGAKATYGVDLSADTCWIPFKGKAVKVLPYRQGSGGTAASITLTDTTAETPVNVIALTAKYVGTDGNSLKITLRDALSDASKREALLYWGTTLKESFTYDKGGNEATNLVAAIAAQGSEYITAAKLAEGNGTLATLTQIAFASGVNPTANGTTVTDGLAAIEAEDWNVVVTDSEENATHEAVSAYLERVIADGKRVQGVVGEPTGVPISTRLGNAVNFNNFALTYVLNGFVLADLETSYEGYKAAAYVAGRLAAGEITQSLTHDVVDIAGNIKGTLTNAQIIQAIESGAMVFTLNPKKRVQIEYDVNTLTTPSTDQDAGWKKNRRVKTRFYLIDEIVAAWDNVLAKLNNDADGRAALCSLADGVIADMIKTGALASGECIVDPDNIPVGDSAWFKIINLVDNDSAEKMYLTIGFQFGS